MSTTQVPREDSRRIAKACLSALLLVGSALVAFAPAVAAHECTAESGETTESECNVACTKGEDHDHQVTHHHENGLAEDEEHVHYSCKSTKEDDNVCVTPRVLEICPIDKAPTVGDIRRLVGCTSSQTATAPELKAVPPPAGC